MQIIDFRIGNLYCFFNQHNNILCDVHFIDKESEQIDGTDLAKIIPIPLNEDMLIKLKFKQYNSIWYNQGIVWVNRKDGTICIGDEFKQVNIRCQIEYVHQLQNLYFALTNTELQHKI